MVCVSLAEEGVCTPTLWDGVGLRPHGPELVSLEARWAFEASRCQVRSGSSDPDRFHWSFLCRRYRSARHARAWLSQEELEFSDSILF